MTDHPTFNLDDFNSADVHVEIDGDADSSSTPRPSGHTVFGQDFGSSEFDYDDLFATGKALRVEAERFVAWCHHMGESIAAASWGQTQQVYARDWRLRHRALAAKFKSDAPPRPEFMEYIFAEPTADVTHQAREELGL